MTVELPLGKRENQMLEFKQAEVLDRPEKVAREVVALLNADGGEVWIGLREEDGRAVELQPIASAQRRGEHLLDSLVDSISPRLMGREVTVEAIDDLLRIVVSPDGSRRPYALVRSGGWFFWRRIGARTVPMTREEIFGSTGVVDEHVAKAVQRVIAARRRAAEQMGDGLWLRLEPARALTIDTDPDSEQFRAIVNDPAATGNRATGWTFVIPNERPQIRQEAIEWGDWDDANEDYRSRYGTDKARVERRGGMTFQVAARRFRWKGEPNEIWPLVLLEYPISAFRIARRIYEGHLQPDDRVVADLAFFGAGAMVLRPGTPGSWFLGDSPRPFREGEDFLLVEPEIFTGREIFEEPDFCGFRLVLQVYEAFGISKSGIPQFFDLISRRLVFPD